MAKLVLVLAIALAAGGAQAQVKCWNDANGRRVCGDTPPPGARVTTLVVPAEAGPAAEADGNDTRRRAPLRPAEQEQDFRKRQAVAQKAAAEAEEKRRNAQLRLENCERSQQAMRTYEEGGRVMRTDSNGERYYLDDVQIAQELARARQAVQQWCN